MRGSPRADPALPLAGYLALVSAIDEPRRADHAGALLALGRVNVPIIYFSVQWWNTLHQGATIS